MYVSRFKIISLNDFSRLIRLCQRLDVVLDSEDGSGDVGKPDKVPALTQGQRDAAVASTKNKRQNGKKSKSDENPHQQSHVTTRPSKRTLQVINIWKADTAFRFETAYLTSVNLNLYRFNFDIHFSEILFFLPLLAKLWPIWPAGQAAPES